MIKVFIIHGFEGSPNGGWRPWLMTELEKQDIYACALSMPSPEKPILSEWVFEITRHIKRNKKDKIYLIGHSLGVPTILRYLESKSAKKIAGAILVSGPCKPTRSKKLSAFLNKHFDFTKIKNKAGKFAVIHGSNDTVVPVKEAKILSEKLECPLFIVQNGGHLNGSSGCYRLPECLAALREMMR